jgi:hypothetical protein
MTMTNGLPGRQACKEIIMRQDHSTSGVRPPRIRRYRLAGFVIALVLSALGMPTAAQAGTGQPQLTVMTYNLFRALS